LKESESAFTELSGTTNLGVSLLENPINPLIFTVKGIYCRTSQPRQ